MNDLDTMDGRLRFARERAGFPTAADAIRCHGWKQSTYNAHENGQNKFRFDKASDYALAYGVRPIWLFDGQLPMTEEEAWEQRAKEPRDKNLDSALDAIIKPNALIGEKARYSRDMTDIVGVAAGGPDGRFLFNGERILSVPTPPSLADVKGAYGVFVHGTSMEPKYDPGQIVFAAPHVPVRHGNYVVVQLEPLTEGEPPSGYVKKFIFRSGKDLVLEQLNPPEGEDKRIVFDNAKVISVHKIVTSDEI